MYTSTSPPLPTLSDVYVYVLYTYTKICPHVCTMYAFYTAEIHQKQGIFLMYATENDVYIKLLYARVYVERQHRGSYRGSVSRLVLGLVSKLHGGYIEASRLVAILVAMSHPIIPLGCTLARCPRGAGAPGRRGRTGAPAGRNAGPRKARSEHVFHRKMISRVVTRLIEHTRNGMEIMLLVHNYWKALWQTLWMD